MEKATRIFSSFIISFDYRNIILLLFCVCVCPCAIVREEAANPAPNAYDTRINHFLNDMEKRKGCSFGLGRSNLQKTDHDRDIKYLRANPSPNKYEPIHPGKRLKQDAVQYSFSSKAHSIDFIEKKKNENKQGPGQYDSERR